MAIEKPFHVAAGKYESNSNYPEQGQQFEPNCKYCEDFATYQEAYHALLTCVDYDWSEIMFSVSEDEAVNVTPNNTGSVFFQL